MKHALLTTDDRIRVELLRARTDDKQAYMKLSILVHLDEGLTQETTAVLLGISSGTVFNSKKKYEQEGLDKFLDRHYVPYAGRLHDEQLAALETEVDEGMYATSAEVAQWIFTHFGVAYTPSAVRALLKKLDFVHKKTQQVPGHVDYEEQADFLSEMEPFLAELLPEVEALYFIDAVHPQHNTRSDYVWVKRGKDKHLSSNAGRKRMNVTGALNFVEPTDVEIIESEKVNGETVRQLLQKLLDKHPDKEVIYIFCDNARYHYNAQLLDWIAQNPKIELLYLPPYSPNLNLIERLWKCLRKKVINLHYYEKFEDFRAAILAFFKNLPQYKAELESLITPNFQRFSVAPRA